MVVEFDCRLEGPIRRGVVKAPAGLEARVALPVDKGIERVGRHPQHGKFMRFAVGETHPPHRQAVGETGEGEIFQGPSPSTGELINYQAFVEELHNIGYNGYLTSEYCLPAVKGHKIAGIDEIDHATKISLQYMKQLVHSAVLS